MADIVEYTIFGDDLQLVEIQLDPHEEIRAEAGTMIYMEKGIEMQTGMGGGVFKGVQRIFTGESFFITSFLNNTDVIKRVAFAAPYPGKIVPLYLTSLGGTFICQKDSFLCAAKGIEIEIAFSKKLGAGLFGGEGFILQRLVGDGLAFAHAGGTIIEKNLKAEEILSVDTGCLVAFSPSVDYDIEFIGGFTNALFGGEGLFLAKLTGPGKVFLQSLPLSRLADRIAVAANLRNVGETKGAAGLGGEILGDIISGL
ncbi:MAG: TIGR00266 family protein [Anaerolineales bacterium]|nr:TIGR00266 family protein [Anaerolineales bacterium]